MTAPAKPALTEADLLAMLRQKLTRPGNGGAGEYALLPHVRDNAGFKSTRTFDAVAVSLWPSRGFTLHCYEVKCSRSDWLRELKEPAKADAAASLCDYFSVVAANSTIVRDGELPPTWGLLVASGDKLRTVVPAPLLPGADPKRPIDRSFLVPMLRSAGAQLAVTPREVDQARRAGIEEGAKRMTDRVRQVTEDLQELRGVVAAFEKAAGVSLLSWNSNPERVGDAVARVLANERLAADVEARLKAARARLAESLAAIDRVLALTAEEPGG